MKTCDEFKSEVTHHMKKQNIMELNFKKPSIDNQFLIANDKLQATINCMQDNIFHIPLHNFIHWAQFIIVVAFVTIVQLFWQSFFQNMYKSLKKKHGNKLKLHTYRPSHVCTYLFILAYLGYATYYVNESLMNTWHLGEA